MARMSIVMMTRQSLLKPTVEDFAWCFAATVMFEIEKLNKSSKLSTALNYMRYGIKNLKHPF